MFKNKLTNNKIAMLYYNPFEFIYTPDVIYYTLNNKKVADFKCSINDISTIMVRRNVDMSVNTNLPYKKGYCGYTEGKCNCKMKYSITYIAPYNINNIVFNINKGEQNDNIKFIIVTEYNDTYEIRVCHTCKNVSYKKLHDRSVISNNGTLILKDTDILKRDFIYSRDHDWSEYYKQIFLAIDNYLYEKHNKTSLQKLTTLYNSINNSKLINNYIK